VRGNLQLRPFQSPPHGPCLGGRGLGLESTNPRLIRARAHLKTAGQSKSTLKPINKLKSTQEDFRLLENQGNAGPFEGRAYQNQGRPVHGSRRAAEVCGLRASAEAAEEGEREGGELGGRGRKVGEGR
jgi:hypothetical protein